MSLKYQDIQGDLTNEMIFYLLHQLIKKRKTSLFKYLVEDNDIRLQELDYAIAKQFTISPYATRSQKAPINEQHERKFTRSRPPKEERFYFTLIDSAQLYESDHSFFTYLLLHELYPLADSLPLGPSENGFYSINAKKVSETYDTSYQAPYQSILVMNHAIRSSSRALLTRKSRTWYVPIMTALGEDQAFEFLKSYIGNLVAALAKAYSDVDSPEKGPTSAENTISQDARWSTIPGFIDLVESIIQLQPISSDEKEKQLLEWRRTDIDLLLTVHEGILVNDTKLSAELPRLRENLLNARLSVRLPSEKRVIPTMKEKLNTNTSTATPSFFSDVSSNIQNTKGALLAADVGSLTL